MERKDKVYRVPYMWGPNYLIYDADIIKQEPASWDILWDERFKGKVATWDDVNNIYMVGQMMGIDRQNKVALYNLTEDQLQEAKSELL
ncbi:ABC transporter substrate-binding protein [Peribacillus sp. TH14]|uniref:ABC transporter substrate-binding protein n=1 Tax=Peribacillus sp. TH14 TaxID=2798481 RepID=UPI001914CE50|nr:extracellular solute-binding protein [Peribacillus sp. TH14]